MKKTKIENNIFIVARKSVMNNRKLDYYMQLPNREENYMFTRNYSTECYEACKAGIPVNRLLHTKQRNRAVMNLVSYLNFMMPYFVEYFELDPAF